MLSSQVSSFSLRRCTSQNLSAGCMVHWQNLYCWESRKRSSTFCMCIAATKAKTTTYIVSPGGKGHVKRTTRSAEVIKPERRRTKEQFGNSHIYLRWGRCCAGFCSGSIYVWIFFIACATRSTSFSGDADSAIIVTVWNLAYQDTSRSSRDPRITSAT